MTFIIAIQLEDSIIVSADKRHVTETEDGRGNDINDLQSKLYLWRQGVITGTGEAYVIERAMEFFIKISKSNIQYLPKCLKISRLMRELEVGNHIQVMNSKLLYSVNDPKTGVQLYSIQPDIGQDKYRVEEFKCDQIMIWFFNPAISCIVDDLKQLYLQLRPFSSFKSEVDWINYYLQQFTTIYKKQSTQDDKMSASFNVFFQTKDHYFITDIDNHHPFTSFTI